MFGPFGEARHGEKVVAGKRTPRRARRSQRPRFLDRTRKGEEVGEGARRKRGVWQRRDARLGLAHRRRRARPSREGLGAIAVRAEIGVLEKSVGGLDVGGFIEGISIVAVVSTFNALPFAGFSR